MIEVDTDICALEKLEECCLSGSVLISVGLSITLRPVLPDQKYVHLMRLFPLLSPTKYSESRQISTIERRILHRKCQMWHPKESRLINHVNGLH
jgi:hypothetical protein